MMADVDVSDIESEDGMITVLVPPTEFFKTKTALQEMNPEIDFEVEEITYLPTMEHPISGEDAEQFERFASLMISHRVLRQRSALLFQAIEQATEKA